MNTETLDTNGILISHFGCEEITGEMVEAFGAFARMHDASPQIIDPMHFDRCYFGKCKSFREFAGMRFRELYLNGVTAESSINKYIDFEAYSEDIGHEFIAMPAEDGEVFVFMID